MPDLPHLSHFNMKIAGSQASQEIIDQMLDCTIENSLHLPDMATLRMHDAAFHWLDAPTFREGTRIELLGAEEAQPFISLFDGEVTALEMDLAAHGTPTLVVRCMDRSHRLHRGRYARTFVQMKDSDIVQKIAQEAGFTAECDATSEVHKWVLQNNQTNWEFLTDRAERNGFRVYVTGERKLCFKRVQPSNDTPVKLDWGGNLRSFRPRLTASPQVDEVIVRGWDIQTKKTIVGRRQNPTDTPRIGEDKTGGELAKSVFGSAKMVVVDRPVHSQSEADILAQSVCDLIGGSFVEAEGLCYGKPELHAGSVVEIGNIGNRFKGKYHVTSVTHTYTPSEGYATLFSVTGKQPGTVLSSLEDDTLSHGDGTHGNIVVGIVTDNLDPLNQGRVKVKYPWLTDEHASDWARVVSPMAGPGRGFFFLPEVNDEVLVAFEHGEITRPYVLGALWNGMDAPVEANSAAVSGGGVNRRTILTRIGHRILLDDTDSKGEVTITTAGGHKVTLDDKNKHITSQTTSGHKVVLDDSNNQIVVTDSTGSNKMTIKTGDSSITLECNGNFTVKSKGKVSIEGLAGVDVKTPAMINLESNGPATLKSTAVLTVQGTLVKIN